MTQITTTHEGEAITKPWEISVNRKPVAVDEPIVTGFQIKEAAIEQGVVIGLDFQLAVVDADGKHRIIGDADKVDLREDKSFFATATDDNA